MVPSRFPPPVTGALDRRRRTGRRLRLPRSPPSPVRSPSALTT
ncbi:hypothetical protein GJR88_01706 [Dietzia sp. DQ12-45-1b]|nr:hypothetical protein GJR88_01706 [Dietzia sp. DQ12-45-1b]